MSSIHLGCPTLSYFLLNLSITSEEFFGRQESPLEKCCVRGQIKSKLFPGSFPNIYELETNFIVLSFHLVCIPMGKKYISFHLVYLPLGEFTRKQVTWKAINL
jgi:hypothetical protein